MHLPMNITVMKRRIVIPATPAAMPPTSMNGFGTAATQKTVSVPWRRMSETRIRPMRLLPMTARPPTPVE